MSPGLIASVLLKRWRLRRHERWTPAVVRARQALALRALRAFATSHSPFYRRFHRGLDSLPLEALPILTRQQLMASFDELVTDRAVRRVDVERHLASGDAGRRYRGRYWVSRTAGSTGAPGLFLFGGAEWSTVVASYARAQEWAGIRAGLTRRTRLAVVSSRSPWHQSARVGLTVDSPFVPVRRFDAGQPLAEIVAGLNEWQPESLVGYASMVRLLAQEQLDGRLAIRPFAVMCSSEPLTFETRCLVRSVWGWEPFDVYAATEAGGIASECALHRLHLFEDLVITEVVDERGQPTPRGQAGARTLVTVLSSRTQPLIRYELSDRLTPSLGWCGCGLPFAVLDGVEGRAEDVLTLPGFDGHAVPIHPVVFDQVFGGVPARDWQVIQEREGLRVLLVRPRAGFDVRGVESLLRVALERVGARAPEVRIEPADALRRTAAGKAPRIVTLARLS